MSILINDIVFSYGKNKVLYGVSFDVNDGEVVSIIGPNGSGKSTLIKCIDGIFKCDSGNVCIDSKNTVNITPREIAKIMAYVPQSSTEVFAQKVSDIVMMGRRPHIEWSVKKDDINKVEKIMEYMDITDIAGSYLDELSGGQKQKVLIARALAQEPKILLLDEPTSSLDIKHQLEVLEIVKKISRKSKTSVIMIIHDLNMAYRFSDKLVLLKDGSVFAYGAPDDVITKDNISNVYDVDVSMVNTDVGPCIIPIRVIEEKCKNDEEEMII